MKGFEAFLDSDHSGSDFIVGVNNLYLNYHHLYDKDTGSAALSTVVERAPEATRLRLLESLDVANALVHTDWTKAIEFSAENPASHEQMGEALVEVSSETRESVADRLASDVGLEQMRDSFFQGWLGKEMNAALGWASGQELPLRDNLIELAYPMIKKNNSEAAGQWLEQISSPEVQARLKGS